MYEIVKSEMFCGNQCDFYESDNNEILMTSTQLGSCLGYSNPQKAIDNLISRNEYLKNIEFSVTLKMRATDGKQYNTRLFTEDGIYEITMLSKTDKARQFRAFVREAIKSIRKHGMYATDELLENPDLAIQVFQKLKEERLERKRLEAENQIMKPKASYYDVVLNCKDLLSVTQIAKDYGKSAVWLNEFLHKKKIQFKQGKCWFLYQKYAEHGYTSTKTQTFNASDGTVHTKVHMYWTQKGRLFLYDLLKSEGVLPLMEQ